MGGEIGSALLALAALAVGGAPAAHAQAPDAEVRAVVARLFDGMRAGDSAAVRSTFLPGAMLATALARTSGPVVQVDTLDQFVRAIGTPHTPVWDERLGQVTVQLDGPLAAVWAEYTFYAGDRLSHCGINAFQLARTAAGWKIVSLVDTRRRDGCPELRR